MAAIRLSSIVPETILNHLYEGKIMPKNKAPQTSRAESTASETVSPHPIRNNVRQLRQERKWTQWQLAQISRLSERTIQRIESGYRVGITAELALAGAFDVEISALYPSASSGKSDKRISDAPQSLRVLQRLVTGAALLDTIETERLSFDAGFDSDPRQRQEVDDFLQHVHAWGMAGRERELIDRVEVSRIFQTKLDELDACGVYVFGTRSYEPNWNKKAGQEGLLVLRRAEDPQISQPRLLRQFGKAMCSITLPMDTLPTRRNSRRKLKS
jgi:transcriptional regulator with XRE-family HTH domain